eukprot:NODE_1748_length_550_cov_491.506986_g1413_i0.p1 GENE.NODE_1748_length_550_cov_491.506986_g1413_i0~~NODE_1748_length_550_cov_491.506986_g1413_i0.p1  ORF type:complete len:133 (+),score=26.88 NODE_1748_length_550_cov_491.506986_g1413_i0:32-400(+)
MGVLILQRDGNSVLEFIQNMEYKFVELLCLPFKESPEHVIRQHISFRYNALKSRLAMMQARLQDVNALVKMKNPSLLVQLQKTSSLSQSVPPPMSTPQSHSQMQLDRSAPSMSAAGPPRGGY